MKRWFRWRMRFGIIRRRWHIIRRRGTCWKMSGRRGTGETVKFQSTSSGIRRTKGMMKAGSKYEVPSSKIQIPKVEPNKLEALPSVAERQLADFLRQQRLMGRGPLANPPSSDFGAMKCGVRAIP